MKVSHWQYISSYSEYIYRISCSGSVSPQQGVIHRSKQHAAALHTVQLLSITYVGQQIFLQFIWAELNLMSCLFYSSDRWLDEWEIYFMVSQHFTCFVLFSTLNGTQIIYIITFITEITVAYGIQQILHSLITENQNPTMAPSSR